MQFTCCWSVRRAKPNGLRRPHRHHQHRTDGGDRSPYADRQAGQCQRGGQTPSSNTTTDQDHQEQLRDAGSMPHAHTST